MTDNFERIAGPFAQATGLPLQFYCPGEYTVGEDPRMPAFCRVMQHGYKSGGRCRQVHLGLQDPDGIETRTVSCFAGLTSTTVPVVRQGKLVGYLHTGHAWVDRKPGCAHAGSGCQVPGRTGRGFPCYGACREIPRLSSERYAGAVAVAELLAPQVAELHALPGNGDSYPAIDRAIRQVRADVVRHWRLPELARRAGMHPSYFSEKFRQRTGQTFTDFLAALRVERARQLLRFTGLPISEIAFASGFRSLSQFNRTYKRNTGHPPGAERADKRAADVRDMANKHLLDRIGP